MQPPRRRDAEEDAEKFREFFLLGAFLDALPGRGGVFTHARHRVAARQECHADQGGDKLLHVASRKFG